MGPKYRRVILKVSGESLAGEQGFGIDGATVANIARQIKDVVALGVEVAVVVGGGNIWRGLSGLAKGVERATADYMGMLATAINALALQDAFIQAGLDARAMTAVRMEAFAEPYTRARAIHHLEHGRIVILGCGLGLPFFSTDTAAVLRAAELGAEVVLMAKNIDGVYTADPRKDPGATRIDRISCREVLARGLGAMDMTAASFCMEKHIPVLVFGLDCPENILRAVRGEEIGTLLTE